MLALTAALVAGAAFAALAALSCARSEPDTMSRLRRDKVLRVGTDATYPPFETIDAGGSGEVVGFDADLMRALGEELGVRVEFLVVPFDGILASLDAGKFDAVISALTITEERARAVLFSEPYHEAGQSVCIRADADIRGAEDLRGKAIGVQLGTTGERIAGTLSAGSVVSFDAIGAAFLDLRIGRLDAVIADTPTARLFAGRYPEVRTVGEAITRESYGIAMRRQDEELKKEMDAALKRLGEQGTLRGLRARWGLEAL
jgi:polar amino acid transport system substrate-binding protein